MSDKNQPSKGDGFIQNGLQHFNIDPKKILALLVGLPIGGAFLSGISTYKYVTSEIRVLLDEEIVRVNYDRQFTLFEKINELHTKILLMDQRVLQCEKTSEKISDLESYVAAKKKK